MLDVYCLCNPLFDVVAASTEDQLKEFDVVKASMTLVTIERQRTIMAAVADSIHAQEAGGSGANTAIGVARLGGKSAFGGCVGQDKNAAALTHSLVDDGVVPNFGHVDVDTGVCLVLLTPDGERTMLTCLGASQHFCVTDVNKTSISDSKVLYVTGYLWDTEVQQQAVLHAMSTAKQAGSLVAFSLSDSFCVHRHASAFVHLLDSHVDIVFGNSAETIAISNCQSVEEACQWLVERTGNTAVVTMGGDGCLIGDKSGITHVPSLEVTVVDTTGAGDIFASGILYGMLHGYTHTQMGRLATHLAAQVITQIGPRRHNLDADAAKAYAFAQ